jgi:hypothetical protein
MGGPANLLVRHRNRSGPERGKQSALERLISLGGEDDLSENPEFEAESCEGFGGELQIKTKAKLCAARDVENIRVDYLETDRVNLAGLNKASTNIFGEFDSGSERTLAAWIRHASRTGSVE